MSRGPEITVELYCTYLLLLLDIADYDWWALSHDTDDTVAEDMNVDGIVKKVLDTVERRPNNT